MYREEMRGRVARTPGCARECTLSKTCRRKALGTSGCFTPLETSHRIKLDPQSTWRTSRDLELDKAATSVQLACAAARDSLSCEG